MKNAIMIILLSILLLNCAGNMVEEKTGNYCYLYAVTYLVYEGDIEKARDVGKSLEINLPSYGTFSQAAEILNYIEQPSDYKSFPRADLIYTGSGYNHIVVVINDHEAIETANGKYVKFYYIVNEENVIITKRYQGKEVTDWKKLSYRGDVDPNKRENN